MTHPISSLLLLFVFVALVFWESLRPHKQFPYGQKWARLKHGVINVGVGFLGTLLVYVFFVPIWGMVTEWTATHSWGLLRLRPLSFGLRFVFALLLLDLWAYLWHRMNHRIKFFWRFHRMHHSDAWMDVTCARRFHPGEFTMSAILRIPIIFLTGVELWHVFLYDMIMGSVTFFHHANIAVSPELDRILRILIPTPIMHKIHHSRLQPETDSNYTALFSVWDRIFRSLNLRRDWENVHLGLDGYDEPDSQSFKGLIKTPLGR